MWQKTWDLTFVSTPVHRTLSLQFTPEAEEGKEDMKKVPWKWGMLFVLRSEADIYAMWLFPQRHGPPTDILSSQNTFREAALRFSTGMCASKQKVGMKCWIINAEGSLSPPSRFSLLPVSESARWWKPVRPQKRALRFGRAIIHC